MKYGLVILLLLSFLVWSDDATAQRRFEGGLTVGMNASQINGDDFAGYNKFGIRGGVRANTILGDRSYVMLEILFSHRGSASVTNDLVLDKVKINTNFIEVPVLFSYKDWEMEDYYKMHGHIGLSYSRLINVTTEGSLYVNETDNFNDNMLGFVLGASFFATKNLSFDLRFNRGITWLYNNKNNPNQNSLFEYFFSIQAAYRFL